MAEEILGSAARALGVELSERQLEQFSRYTKLLIEWNEKFNLTSITDPVEIALKHHLDSLTCLVAADFPEEALAADVGTGAGFPGIPLAIARPDLRLVLIESTKKKLTFLEEAVSVVLGPPTDARARVELVHSRAEEVGRRPEHRERYDVVVARAVAELRVLAEYCLPLVRLGGLFIAMKGPEVDEELDRARPGIGTLGGSQPKVTRLVLPFTDMGRSLITVKKVTQTPDRFPRSGAAILKRPL